MNHRRGMECELPTDQMYKVLERLADESRSFYVRRCMAIDEEHRFIPGTTVNYAISAKALRELAQSCIWELVLDVYPCGSPVDSIVSYSDFQKSACLCRLIFCDCRELELYIKDAALFAKLSSLLRSLNAENMRDITDASDRRTELDL